jgi:nucleoside-diphosphate-sugar epimerase
MKRVLVTGASGFIGKQCIPLLLAKGYEVHALARSIPSTVATSDTIWHEADLLSPGSPSKIFQRIKPDSLLHLAWYAIPGKFWEAPENRDWVRASMKVFEGFVSGGGRRLVAAGSCAEYANRAGQCVENRTPLAPTTLYGSCKHELRGKLDAWSAQTGIGAAWGRIFQPYGPQEDTLRLAAYAIRSLLRNEPALCSDGLHVADFLHVQDVASAFVALLASPVNGAVNIASGKPVEVRAVLKEIGRQIGRPELIRLGARVSTAPPERRWGNVTRLTREVGWQPKFDLESGLADAIEWWRNAD